MKILYGVQGTGNGHITRARAMAKALDDKGLDVQFLVSGRPKLKLFDMEPFGDYWWREGLTFRSKKGRVVLSETVVKSRPIQLAQDIKDLDVSSFDLIVTDYEPITAWAGRIANVKVLGLGHQYAFGENIPTAKMTMLDKVILENFAPADYELGLHWHHFGAPILPPIAPVHEHTGTTSADYTLVYLPFEAADDVSRLLGRFENSMFVVYHPDKPSNTADNVIWREPSRITFPADLAGSSGVICNAGFELASEALQLGKKILVKPLAKQVEQHCNALALETLGWGSSMEHLDPQKVNHWLNYGHAVQLEYPDTAAMVAEFIAQGADGSRDALVNALWEQTSLPPALPSEDRQSIAA